MDHPSDDGPDDAPPPNEHGASGTVNEDRKSAAERSNAYSLTAHILDVFIADLPPEQRAKVGIQILSILAVTIVGGLGIAAVILTLFYAGLGKTTVSVISVLAAATITASPIVFSISRRRSGRRSGSKTQNDD